MNGHVHEDAAGDFDVRERRWRWIAADDVHQAGRADFARSDSLADARKVCIEAPVEADLQLHAGRFHSSQGAIDLVEAEGNRLFAEDVLAGFGGLRDQIRVCVGGGADQHHFDLFVGENLVARCCDLGNVAACSQCLRGLAVDVRDRDDLGFWQAEGQRFRVDTPDASGADDSDVQLLRTQCAPLDAFLERYEC